MNGSKNGTTGTWKTERYSKGEMADSKEKGGSEYDTTGEAKKKWNEETELL